MNDEQLCEKIEEEIENMEYMKLTFDKRLDDVIQRLKEWRFKVKYEK